MKWPDSQTFNEWNRFENFELAEFLGGERLGFMHVGFLGIFVGGGCCCFIFLAIGAFIVFKRMKGKKKPTDDASNAGAQNNAAVGSIPMGGVQTVGRVAQYGNLIARIADGGFYIYNQFLAPGSVVNYRFKQDGAWVSRSVTYAPGPQGHFVYLGGTPTDIQVVDVTPPSGAAAVNDPARTMITANRSPNAVPPPPA